MTLTEQFADIAVRLSHHAEQDNPTAKRIKRLLEAFENRHGSLLTHTVVRFGQEEAVSDQQVQMTEDLARAMCIRALSLYRYGYAWYGSKCELFGYSVMEREHVYRKRNYIRVFHCIDDMDRRLGSNAGMAAFRLRFGNGGIDVTQKCGVCGMMKTLCQCRKKKVEDVLHLPQS